MAANISYAIFRQSKIRDYANFSKALGHTNREWDVPNANNDVDNQYLISTPLEKIKERCEKARTRKDNVLGYDLLFTASPEFFTDTTDSEKIERWKKSTIRWIEKNFGAENIVNLAVHMDETTPHIACQTVAIHNGKLNAKHFTGGSRNRMSELQDSYAAAVSDLGLIRGERGSLATHEEIKKYYSRTKEAETATADQLPKITIQLESPKKNMLGFYAEDPRDYFDRHFDRIKPQIQKLIDENQKLRKEIANLQKEIKHWRSAREWTRNKAQNFEKLKGKYRKVYKAYQDTNTLLKKINPKALNRLIEEPNTPSR